MFQREVSFLEYHHNSKPPYVFDLVFLNSFTHIITFHLSSFSRNILTSSTLHIQICHHICHSILQLTIHQHLLLRFLLNCLFSRLTFIPLISQVYQVCYLTSLALSLLMLLLLIFILKMVVLVSDEVILLT